MTFRYYLYRYTKYFTPIFSRQNQIKVKTLKCQILLNTNFHLLPKNNMNHIKKGHLKDFYLKGLEYFCF